MKNPMDQALYKITLHKKQNSNVAPCGFTVYKDTVTDHRNDIGNGIDLNMELDLQSLFGLHVTGYAQLYSLAETPQSPHPPAFGLDILYEGAIGQPRYI
jgi:hypothetical protein